MTALTASHVYKPAQQVASIEVTVHGTGTKDEVLATALAATGETTDSLHGWTVNNVGPDLWFVALHRS